MGARNTTSIQPAPGQLGELGPLGPWSCCASPRPMGLPSPCPAPDLELNGTPLPSAGSGFLFYECVGGRVGGDPWGSDKELNPAQWSGRLHGGSGPSLRPQT